MTDGHHYWWVGSSARQATKCVALKTVFEQRFVTPRRGELLKNINTFRSPGMYFSMSSISEEQRTKSYALSIHNHNIHVTS